MYRVLIIISPRDEWGSFSLAELQNYTGKFGLGIERDLYFGEKRISEVVPSAKG